MDDAHRHGPTVRPRNRRGRVQAEEFRAPLHDAHRREDGPRIARLNARREADGQRIEPTGLEVTQPFGLLAGKRIQARDLGLDVAVRSPVVRKNFFRRRSGSIPPPFDVQEAMSASRGQCSLRLLCSSSAGPAVSVFGWGCACSDPAGRRAKYESPFLERLSQTGLKLNPMRRPSNILLS
jgi:hypothetical protein